MVSKFQWKPFWLATQRDSQNDWAATQNRVNYDVDKGRFSTRNSARHPELVTHSGGTLFNFLQNVLQNIFLQNIL